jgi:hypothetical protein
MQVEKVENTSDTEITKTERASNDANNQRNIEDND